MRVNDMDKDEGQEQPIVSFQVITDMHITGDSQHAHNQNVRAVLQDITTTDPNSDALIMLGDNTDSGREEEYREFERIFRAYEAVLPATYFIQGNHDVRWGDWTLHAERFKTYTKMTSHYYDVWIKGIHFIFLGTERGLKDYSYLSKSQLQWLEEKLEEDQSGDKPVFVFHHQPLKNTVAGANESYHENNFWYGVRQDRELKQLLAKHPRAIMFSGHTHWELGSKDTMVETPYATLFHTGAASYLWSEEHGHRGGSQGYFVEVYKDKVLVRGRDFLSSSWLAAAQFEVSLTMPREVDQAHQEPDLTISHPSFVLDKEMYKVGESIQATYSGSVWKDWIGIFPAGVKLGKSVSALAVLRPCDFGQPDGHLLFEDIWLPSGEYEAIYVGEAEYRTENDHLELERVKFKIVEG